MKSITIRLFLFLGALLSSTAFANVDSLPANVDVVPLAGITNDRDSNVSYLKLMLGENNAVRGIYLQTHAHPRKASDDGDVGANGGAFSLAEIESDKGVVLRAAEGRKVILLRGSIDSQAGKGSLVITYLTNGLSMSYGQCKVGLRKSGAREWKLVNAYNGKNIKDIEIKTWWLGISTLGNVCPGSGTAKPRAHEWRHGRFS